MKKIRFKSMFKNMSKKKKIITALILAAVIVAVVFLIHSCGSRSDEETAEEEVLSAVAEKMTITQNISSKGEIKSALEEKKTPHAGYTLEKINVTEGQAVKEGKAILTYTNGQTMTAPYDCVVLEWDLPDPKQTVSNDDYVKIAGTKVMLIEVSVGEDEVFLIKKGSPATIKVDATDSKYKGEVSFVSDVGEYEEGMSQFKVKVLFNNDGNLKLGMNGKAKITLAKAENVIGVPVDAVSEDGESSSVTVRNGDNPEDTKDVEVETGISDGEFVEIKSGLKEGDVVQYYSNEDEAWEEEGPYY